MVNDRTKETILGIGLCLVLISIAAIILYTVVESGVRALGLKYDPQYAATSCLELAAFVAFITCFDIPERIHRSKYLSDLAVLIVYLGMFLFFVFGFLSEILRYRVGGRVVIIAVLVILGSWSIAKVIQHTAQSRSSDK
jgi:hypothetical protein